MNKKSFIGEIDNETLVAMVDKALSYEKNKQSINSRANLLKLIPAVASIILVIGVISILSYLPIFNTVRNNDGDPSENIYTPVADTTEIPEIPVDDLALTENDNERLKFQVNVNPKSKSKWKGITYDNGDGQTFNSNSSQFDTINNSNISYNINQKASTTDGIEIHFPNGIILKTHDNVKIDTNDDNIGTIKIAGDTIINLDCNIITEGSGKFTIINKDGVKTDINGGNQSTYSGNNPDGEANKNYTESGLKGISDLLPYMSQNAIDEIASKEYDKVGRINKLDELILYAMSENLLSELLSKECEQNGIKSISDDILVYMSKSVVDELARKEYEKSGLKGIGNITWFMSKSTIDEIALKEYEKNGLRNIGEIAWAMSRSALEELALREYAATETVINTKMGKVINMNDNGMDIIETPLIGEIKYLNIENKSNSTTAKLGKDGEFAEIFVKNSGKTNSEASVTVKDSNSSVVIQKDKDGAVSVITEKNGKNETTLINPDVQSDMTVELNGKTVEISQASKGGTAIIIVKEGDITAKIKIAKNANTTLTEYLADSTPIG